MFRVFIISVALILLAACSPDSESTEGSAARVKEGTAWLLENAKKEAVTVTDSGLQYEVLATGSGASPGPTDIVLTHYEGKYLSGEVFDSSVQRGEPLEFPLNRVIRGWTEGLQLMKEGDKWRLFVPSELGYGKRGAGSIPGDTVLIFEVELLEVKSG